MKTSIHQIPTSTNDGWQVKGTLKGEPFVKTFDTLEEAQAFIGKFIRTAEWDGVTLEAN